MLEVIPRRLGVVQAVELSVRVEGDVVVLEPAGVSLRFLLMHIVMFVAFGGLSYAWYAVVKSGGNRLMAPIGIAIGMLLWYVVFRIGIASMLNARAGGPLCRYDRRLRVFEAPREGSRIRGASITEVCLMKVTQTAINGNESTKTHTNQLLCRVANDQRQSQVLPLAMQCFPASAAARFAKECGAEFTRGKAPVQDGDVWSNAPDWSTPKPMQDS